MDAGHIVSAHITICHAIVIKTYKPCVTTSAVTLRQGLLAMPPDRVWPGDSDPVITNFRGERIAKQFVDPAALLLSGVLRRLSQAELIAHLNAALASRAVIDQAIGIVMARRGCKADEAFAVLRRISNDRNVKLRDVAAAIAEAVAAGKRDALGV
jgi:hypothetical protein